MNSSSKNDEVIDLTKDSPGSPKVTEIVIQSVTPNKKIENSLASQAGSVAESRDTILQNPIPKATETGAMEEEVPFVGQKNNKSKEIVRDFGWISFDREDLHEVNYLKHFIRMNKDQIDYSALDIENLNPNPTEFGKKGSHLQDMLKRIHKYGKLDPFEKKKKKRRDDIDDYDIGDSFIDDTGCDFEQTPNKLAFIESSFDDFVCYKGGIQDFLKSDYYVNRMNLAKEIEIKALDEDEESSGGGSIDKGHDVVRKVRKESKIAKKTGKEGGIKPMQRSEEGNEQLKRNRDAMEASSSKAGDNEKLPVTHELKKLRINEDESKGAPEKMINEKP